ncbi:prolyl aminopeptidase [Mycoplasmopsis alligatoris]|uniref:Proline iminopeptidase n=1 Tax=Mycoplasmopsis alligatoris A21JP2 TaxID=747682 RepID=D4XWQ3_9BACT|nr:prolyl aminopeptidase [Mycoplasmopsis alligatoris]EFF41365.1 prolyl aminopeptidase [Mycoplasmopsis alligatoris A21JP2]
MEHIVYEEGYLKVDNNHEIYYELSGNKNGIPVFYFHGGPGGSTNVESKKFFDPKFYNIVVFDQRGAGKSKPSASIINNNTWALISDIEALRKKIKAKKILVFGGSWGSTLALAYAIKHSENVLGLILRGIFLGTKEEYKWLYQSGIDQFYPDIFEIYKNYVPKEKQNNLLSSYYELLQNKNLEKAYEAANYFSYLESNAVSVSRNNYHLKTSPKEALEISLLETHYFVNNCFFESDNWILENTDKIKDIKTYIVHGRYDMVTLVKNAYKLDRKLNNSTLFIVEESGHSTSEKAIKERLLWCVEDFKKHAKKL